MTPAMKAFHINMALCSTDTSHIWVCTTRSLFLSPRKHFNLRDGVVVAIGRITMSSIHNILLGQS